MIFSILSPLFPRARAGFPQFSFDVRYTIDKTQGSGVINTLPSATSDAPVDPNKTYRFCTNDYLFSGGDGYTVMKKSVNLFNTSLLLSYVVIEYIKAQNGAVSPAVDRRLTVIGGVTL